MNMNNVLDTPFGFMRVSAVNAYHVILSTPTSNGIKVNNCRFNAYLQLVKKNDSWDFGVPIDHGNETQTKESITLRRIGKSTPISNAVINKIESQIPKLVSYWANKNRQDLMQAEIESLQMIISKHEEIIKQSEKIISKARKRRSEFT